MNNNPLLYRDFEIERTEDFVSGPGFYIDSSYVKSAYQVFNNCDEVFYGLYFLTVEEAKEAIDIHIDSAEGNSYLFWSEYYKRKRCKAYGFELFETLKKLYESTDKKFSYVEKILKRIDQDYHK